MSAFAACKSLWKKLSASHRPFSAAAKAHLAVESLESRLVPYSMSGNAWPHSELVTLSFMPDGTNLGGVTSSLFGSFNSRFGSVVRWQTEILRAAQVWAQQTNLNFAVVTDSGAASGSGGYQQGDPSFGDIRIGGYQFGSSTLARAYMPPPVNNYSVAGDLTFNVGQSFNVGTTFDLFTTAAHEFGHALGLNHSSVSAAVLYSTFNGTKTALNSDDIAGGRAVYGGARSQDRYDVAASNGSLAAATNLSSQIDTTTGAALISDLDITTVADADYYKVTAPAGTNGTFTVTVQSQRLSLLAPLVRVYNASQQQVGYVTGAGKYGTILTVTLSNVVAGQEFYVLVDGADNTAFGTGRYALGVNFGAGTTPGAAAPNTMTANGATTSAGGGQGKEFTDLTNPLGTVFGVGSAVLTGLFGDLSVGQEHGHDHPHGYHDYGPDGHEDGCGCSACTGMIVQAKPVLGAAELDALLQSGGPRMIQGVTAAQSPPPARQEDTGPARPPRVAVADSTVRKETIPPAPELFRAESQSPEAEQLSTTREEPPSTFAAEDTVWARVNDLYFTESMADFGGDGAAPAAAADDQPAPAGGDTAPLTGLGVVLGGLLVGRAPNAVRRGRERPVLTR